MGYSVPLTIHSYVPETNSRQVLLCNPPIYDTRFPWARFQQPATLLQLSTLLRRYGCDVRLLDALATEPDASMLRRRMRILTRDDIKLNWWRFGRLPSELAAQLLAFKHEGWQPNEVYIDGFATFWWEGVVEMVKMVRHHFPHARIILCGAYPTLAPDHAIQQCEVDIIALGEISGVAGLSLDLTHYPTPPTFTYLSIGTAQRSADDLVNEFLSNVFPKRSSERVRQFAFIDHDVVKRFPDHFRAVLQASLDYKCKISFLSLGNFHPSDLIDDPELASLLKRAGFKQIVFADDRYLPCSVEARAQLLDEYSRAIDLCIAAGYPKRTEALVASVSLGRSGEDPGEVVTFMTKLAHIAGSLMVIPYQPNPAECSPSLPLEMQNGKLFPFAEENHLSFRGYQDILGLAAILNAKYRNHTFDFLGDGLISHLVRESLVTESWDPHNSPGINHPVIVGWFNKEGKWVRS
jgi:Fe-S oxidoreductase